MTVTAVLAVGGFFAATWVQAGSLERDWLNITTDAGADRSVWGLEDAPDLGLELVAVEGPDGPLRAWTADGDDDTWIVFVHGNGADPSEAFRLARAVAAAGYPVLVTSYRDDGAHGYGYDEWIDIEAALAEVFSDGAADVVLVGYGSGASIVGTYLYEGREVDRVLAVVADAPMLSLQTVVDDAWRASGVPGWAVGWTKAVASLRYGIDLGAIDHLDRMEGWTVPTLILHGRDDGVFPLEVSETFALAKPDQVRLLTFPGAGPGESWNLDPERYEEAALGFIDAHAAGPSAVTIEP